MNELNSDRWCPVAINSISQRLVNLELIPIGGTFQWRGEFWRRFESGVRRQRGRAPKTLTILSLDTLVWSMM